MYEAKRRPVERIRIIFVRLSTRTEFGSGAFSLEDDMKIAKHYDDGKLTIYLYGELDHHAARGTMKVISDLMLYELPKQTVLDFGGLTFMDSSGIALLLKTHRIAAANNGKVWVEHPNRQVLRVLEASGVQRFVPIAQETGKE